MKSFKLTLAAALLGTLAAGSAQAYTISASTIPTGFTFENLGTGNNSGGLQSTYTTPTDGQSFVFTGNSGVYSGNASGIVASPFGSAATNYLAAQPGGSLILHFATPQTALNLLWGSVDSYNGLSIVVDGVTISGQDILNANSALVAGTSDAYVSIAGLGPFTDVSVTSTQSAFEFVAGTAVTPVPEPLTLSLFGAGLAGLGFAKRRKKAKSA